MASDTLSRAVARNIGKFRHPEITADGSRRAQVGLKALETLWFNTGTLCNLACADCYIESSPTNDRLVYISAAEVAQYLDEIEARGLATHQIGFTGGEPFMNPDFLDMLEDSLARGYRALVLTNAMRPMMKCADGLAALGRGFGDKLVIRVSLDHYQQTLHEQERGPRSWQPAMHGLEWLRDNDFTIHIAGRLKWGQPEADMRAGFAQLIAERGLDIDAYDPGELVLFPEMDETASVPEITEACWNILGVAPQSVMCATSRMVVKRKGAPGPMVVPCTLLPYNPAFEMGTTLAASDGPVWLNHPHCAKFCVLGGATCSQD